MLRAQGAPVLELSARVAGVAATYDDGTGADPDAADTHLSLRIGPSQLSADAFDGGLHCRVRPASAELRAGSMQYRSAASANVRQYKNRNSGAYLGRAVIFSEGTMNSASSAVGLTCAIAPTFPGWHSASHLRGSCYQFCGCALLLRSEGLLRVVGSL